MTNTYFVYMMTNNYNNVLYIGVTNDLTRRVAEHKAIINKSFTEKYNCNKLVYFEIFYVIQSAIIREKQLKNGKREWENKLITEQNMEWNDLTESIGVSEELIEKIGGQARNDSRLYLKIS